MTFELGSTAMTIKFKKKSNFLKKWLYVGVEYLGIYKLCEIYYYHIRGRVVIYMLYDARNTRKVETRQSIKTLQNFVLNLDLSQTDQETIGTLKYYNRKVFDGSQYLDKMMSQLKLGDQLDEW